ncbi:threonine-phosphate decarboxylase [Pandoraea terrae]|uniref:threonine-phosphate decarboxylase n=1 Tax=Pandoraea terrae TaxID=1537710 RepID=A0A5E4RJJ0_9BURK|nr:threonine-phosphate decarboxylase CobD [Pandoraea terrae]VVD63285.1 threonine-phosphate decarboxylase [Pandoraea terrae]
MNDTCTPRHGGNLGDAVRRYDRPREDWLDLSTGINPHGYPVPPIPAQAWQRLPDDDDGLRDTASAYYGVPASHIAAAAGSQAVIRTLPRLLRPGRVAIAPLTYSEYAPAFAAAGHTPVAWPGPHAALPDADYVVCVNPNNPTTDVVPVPTLRAWQMQLAARGGMLILDEAFGDVSPDASLARSVGEPGLIVLRSVGKFFGLAGVRAGFVLAEPVWAQRIAHALGAWTVNGPARFVVRHALADTVWQATTRARLLTDGTRLAGMLARGGLPVRGMALFAWIPHPLAPAWHAALAQLGIWTRLFDPLPQGANGETMPSLRVGLPGTPTEWTRLENAIGTLGVPRRGP